MSSWGDKIKITVYGASHAKEIGVEIEGLPKDLKIDLEAINEQLQRRAPGRSKTATQRKEPDIPEIITGLILGKTTGETLRMVIKNTNIRRGDYDVFKKCPRPGHADYTALVKYDGLLDMSGGGPFSGRMTAPMVFAGEICRQLLETKGISIAAHISEIAGIYDTPFDDIELTEDLFDELREKSFAVINKDIELSMLRVIKHAMIDLDSVGGVVECAVTGMPVGIGGPMFDGIEGNLASFLFGIPAVKGVEFGKGFKVAKLRGSQNNDEFCYEDGKVVTKTNNCGGILGGISNGMPIIFRAAIKPTPSIAKRQNTVNLETKQNAVLEIKGRHDPCIVPRAVPVVEAAAAIVIANMIL